MSDGGDLLGSLDVRKPPIEVLRHARFSNPPAPAWQVGTSFGGCRSNSPPSIPAGLFVIQRQLQPKIVLRPR